MQQQGVLLRSVVEAKSQRSWSVNASACSVHAAFRVVGDRHRVGGVAPSRALLLVDAQGGGRIGKALHGPEGLAQVTLGHEVGVDVVVGHRRVLVGPGDAVDAKPPVSCRGDRASATCAPCGRAVRGRSSRANFIVVAGAARSGPRRRRCRPRCETPPCRPASSPNTPRRGSSARETPHRPSSASARVRGPAASCGGASPARRAPPARRCRSARAGRRSRCPRTCARHSPGRSAPWPRSRVPRPGRPTGGCERARSGSPAGARRHRRARRRPRSQKSSRYARWASSQALPSRCGSASTKAARTWSRTAAVERWRDHP